jgi:hypothetical protein
MCHVTIQKQKEIAEAAAQQSQPKQVIHTASYHSPYIPEYVGESAFIPFVSFGDLDNNTFKGLTSLLSVEQEIQYDEHT